jgi:oxygen-dependent protoporphyrinogen oxidase
MAVITLGFARGDVGHDVDGFGHLIPTREGRRLLGALWTSSIFSDRAPDGHVLIRAMAGGPHDPGILELRDDALVDMAVKELTPVLDLRGAPARSWVIRHPFAIAQYKPGHLRRMKDIDEALADWPGLVLTGSSYRGISVNYCAKEAEAAAAQILDHLAARHAATGGGV